MVFGIFTKRIDMDSDIKALLEQVKSLQNELDAQKKTTKNALKLSIGVGILCFSLLR